MLLFSRKQDVNFSDFPILQGRRGVRSSSYIHSGHITADCFLSQTSGLPAQKSAFFFFYNVSSIQLMMDVYPEDQPNKLV